MESDLVRSQYSLSIRFFPDGFSLFMFDENMHLISQKHQEIIDFYMSDIENLLDNHLEFHNNYQHVSVFVESLIYSVIPTKLENSLTNRAMIELQYPSLEKEAEIISQIFIKQGFTLLWAIPQKLLQAIHKKFANKTIFHHLTDLLSDQINRDEDIAIWLRIGEADFIISRKKKILLCSSIEFKTSEDVVYHTLNFLRQLQLDIEQCAVNLYYDNNDFQTEQLLKKFLPQITGHSKKTIYENYQREI